jgi:FtsP/CotA-like multicopper oxidase with cupredoxin domain
MEQMGHHISSTNQEFPRAVVGLPPAQRPQSIEIAPGESLDLRIGPVVKQITNATVRMLAYNGSIPGPSLRVRQGSEIAVNVTNDGDELATVHWHGLRLENRYDGVPHETQEPIPIGGRFTYRVQFPDPGFYWYHPHIREDFGQEMGLYGTIVVEPSDAEYWPPVERELTLTLDDVLIEDGDIAPFRPSGATFTAMGRFGNVMLINGETEFSGRAAVGEVGRMYLVNTANTRIFNLAIRGGRMKLVGGDSGRYERETFVDEVLLAPSERAVVDVLFDTEGDARLEHRTPDHVYDLGHISISGKADGVASKSFDTLRTDPELTALHQSIDADLERPPDKVLAFVSSMPLLFGRGDVATSEYACPMHPEVTDSEPSSCPKCGMKLIPVQAESPGATSYACPMHPEVTNSEPTFCPKCRMQLVPTDEGSAPGPEHHQDGGRHEHDEGDGSDGLEWEDLMPDINRQSNPSNMIWQLVDRETGAANAAIAWSFKVGDRVKIRLVNEMAQDHPMHHPFHVHGAGRFIVLSRQGEPEANLVWKDTVLLPAGHTVDILLDVSNPGLWMAHCHIAEHTESGMMFSFNVARNNGEQQSAGREDHGHEP